MPRLSVWMARTALLHLGAGFTLGALLLFHKGVPIAPWAWRLLPLHIEMLLFGWTAQLALGVAFWILPRFMHGAPRGDERLAWASYALLNAGVLAAGAAPWLAGGEWLALAGRGAELLAGILFAAHAWPRVKPYGV